LIEPINSNRVVLVTGASRGIGKALAARFVEQGQTVFGLSRSESSIEDDGYHHIKADISNESEVRGAFDTIRDHAGRLDVLINNAGLKTNGFALLTTSGQANEMLTTNLLGAFMVTREAVKLMKRHQFGRVVSLSSVAVPMGGKGCAIYSATKAGVTQLHHAASQEHAAENITFNTVGVSIFEESLMVDSIDPKALKSMREQLIKPDSLTVDEILHAVAFFTAAAAANITNQIVYFGGVR
jgi:3-oxoacyl-[acyl-carrier protein] reductase